MRCLIIIFSIAAASIPIYGQKKQLGSFNDDYGNTHLITDSLWAQKPNSKYRIIEWDKKNNFIIAQNDKNNPTGMELFTRIDYIRLKKKKPYKWGFCLTMYNGESVEVARNSDTSDKSNPKKGCNGHPFSRMKRIKNK